MLKHVQSALRRRSGWMGCGAAVQPLQGPCTFNKSLALVGWACWHAVIPASTGLRHLGPSIARNLALQHAHTQEGHGGGAAAAAGGGL